MAESEALLKKESSTRNRPRRKEILRKLKEQVEFYFGDINLNRDRFLHHKIADSEEGFVPVEMIAGFNRMKAISQDISLIVKAMRQSDMLEVSEDGNMVRRATAIESVKNTNDRTLYVEDLPPNASIDNLRADFSSCGGVEYVNLPRFKDSKEIKGFAWITFSKPGGVLKALKLFDNFDSGLEPLYPSLGVSDKEERAEERAEGTGQEEDDSRAGSTPLQGDKTPGNEEGMVKSRKRPHTEVTDASSELGESQEKPSSSEPTTGDHSTKSRNDGPTQTSPTPVCPCVVEPSPIEFPNSESSNVQPVSSEPPSKMKKVDETLQPEGSEDGVPVEAAVKTKSRRHKKKKNKKNTDAKQPYKVLHQLEWIRLKKLYLKLQKQEMSKIKKAYSDIRLTSSTHDNDDAFYDPAELRLQDTAKRGADKVLKKMLSSSTTRADS